MRTVQKPAEGEYAPYAIAYIDLVPNDGLIFEHLRENLQMVKNLVGQLPDEKLSTPCAPGEWTIKEILVHVMDAERIFAYRALRFARHDTTELPGWDQDAYAPFSGANARTIESILDELTAVRQASIALFSTFDDETMQRVGIANNHNLSVRSALYQIAGHELHHVNSIKENYLS